MSAGYTLQIRDLDAEDRFVEAPNYLPREGDRLEHPVFGSLLVIDVVFPIGIVEGDLRRPDGSLIQGNPVVEAETITFVHDDFDLPDDDEEEEFEL